MKKYKKLNEDAADNYLDGFYKVVDSVAGPNVNNMMADELKKQDLHNASWGGISQYRDDIEAYKSGNLEPLSRLDPDGYQKIQNQYALLKQISPEIAENLKKKFLQHAISGTEKALEDYKQNHKVEAFVYDNPKTTAGIGLGAAAALGYGAYRLANRNKNRNQMINQL